MEGIEPKRVILANRVRFEVRLGVVAHGVKAMMANRSLLFVVDFDLTLSSLNSGSDPLTNKQNVL